MILTASILVLAQVAAATPSPTPTPRPIVHQAKDVTPVQDLGPGNNLGASAGKIKLKRGVSFDQDQAPILPTPTPVPISKGGAPAAPAAAAPAEGRADLEKKYRDRYEAARRSLEDAVVASRTANANAPGCMTYSGKNWSTTDCSTRDAALLPYKTSESAAALELARVKKDCQDDIQCMPYWVQPR